MMKTVRCAIIDLQSGSARSVSVSADGKFVWAVCCEDGCCMDGAVTLSTGPLTGMGVPGGSGMTWHLNNKYYPAEGRVASALRFAGWDHLVLTGKCPEGTKADITIHGEDIAVKLVSASARETAHGVYAKVMKARPNGASVILVPAQNGMMEDDCFLVSARGVSAELRAMGVRSLTVSGEGALAVADPAALRALCVDLWLEVKGWKNNSDAEHPARYLSVMPGAGLEMPAEWGKCLYQQGSDAQILAAMGLCWGSCAEKLGGVEMAAKLLAACTGEAADLQQCVMVKGGCAK